MECHWLFPNVVKVDDNGLVAGTNLVGQLKATVRPKLGQPDEKRVFNGAEYWEYYEGALFVNG